MPMPVASFWCNLPQEAKVQSVLDEFKCSVAIPVATKARSYCIFSTAADILTASLAVVRKESPTAVITKLSDCKALILWPEEVPDAHHIPT